jgi:hypothetical protein
MFMDLDHEPLPESRCWDLLGQAEVGHVGVTIGALPAIVPVRYAVVGPVIAFPTAARTKLTAAADGHVLAFQADAQDELGWWSVHAIGRGDLIRDDHHGFAPLAEALAATGRNHDGWIVSIEPALLVGSRMRPTA